MPEREKHDADLTGGLCFMLRPRRYRALLPSHSRPSLFGSD